MTIKCPYCGFENPDTSSFCGNCAQNTIDTYNKKNDSLQRRQSRQQGNLDIKNNSTVGCLLVAGVLFMLIGGFVLYAQVDGPRNAPKIQEKPMEVAKPITLVEGKLVKRLNFKSYVYETGVTNDPDLGLMYHIFTDKQHYTIPISKTATSVEFSDQIEVEDIKYSLAKGISSHGDQYSFTKDNCFINGAMYEYDMQMKHMLEYFSIETLAVSDKYVIIFSKGNHLTAGKIKNARREIDNFLINTSKRFKHVNSAYYDDLKDALYVTDGKQIVRYKVQDIYKLHKEIDDAPAIEEKSSILFVGETVWSITKCKDIVLVITTGDDKSDKKIYAFDENWFTEYAEGPYHFKSIE